MEISNTKDGSMLIKLYQPTGIKEIMVTEAEGKEIIELNRIEYNDNHRETRRHVSLDAYDPYGALVKDNANPLQKIINKEEIEQLHHSIGQLNPEQQKLLMKKFWDDMKQIDIAKEEDVSKMAITKRLQTIYRNLKKILQNQSFTFSFFVACKCKATIPY